MRPRSDVRRTRCGAACPAPPSPLADCCVDFSAPYHVSGFALVSRAGEGPSSGGVMRALEEPALINATLVVLAGLLVSGAVILLAELPAGAAREIRSPTNALYWAVTTLTTVGFGDIVARSPAGRFVTVAWTLTSFVSMSVLSSLLTSSLTSARLAAAPVDALGDVVGALCVEGGYPLLDAFLARAEGTPTRLLRRSLGGCLDAVLSREAHAAVSDRPALTWRMATQAGGLPPMHLSPQLSAHPLALAFAADSPLRAFVNPAIIAAQADPVWAPFVDGMRTIYFSVPNVSQAAAASEGVNRELIITVAVLACFFAVGQAVYMARFAGGGGGGALWGWASAQQWGRSSSSLRRASRALPGGGANASFGSADGGGADGGADAYDDGGGGDGSAAALAAEVRSLSDAHEASAAAMRGRLAALEARASAAGAAASGNGGGSGDKAARTQMRALSHISVNLSSASASALTPPPQQQQHEQQQHAQGEAVPFGALEPHARDGGRNSNTAV
jgi:ABC-type amino acid transport substrate-binding protein